MPLDCLHAFFQRLMFFPTGPTLGLYDRLCALESLKSTGSRTGPSQQGKPQDACTCPMVLLWLLDDEDQCFSNWTTDRFLQGASWRMWARGEVLASHPALRFNDVYQFYTTGFFMDSVTTAIITGQFLARSTKKDVRGLSSK